MFTTSLGAQQLFYKFWHFLLLYSIIILFYSTYFGIFITILYYSGVLYYSILHMYLSATATAGVMPAPVQMSSTDRTNRVVCWFVVCRGARKQTDEEEQHDEKREQQQQ